ncbi:hypothetical protein IGB42_02230 [Andreprevotia sp. IGB-42]|uniref:histidine phosphatase family protein n=1 Tax=Andreprevotia sp. IGB-42 TaxID=2497473 RepID=UPI00135AF553|nr:histidine phosphatase family protein [Andreprevotia sp. IGB-42]KAF0813301.1 hypothetical protein IGB42_02230 [Andreprevotia sp. IGB-42]
MTTRLQLFSLASTPAMRKGRFPADEALDERGRDETIAAGLIAHLPAHATLLCSPAAMARDTAALWQRPAIIEPALADMDHGHWRGRGLAEVAAETPAALAAWTRQAEAPAGGAESFLQVLARVGRWQEQLDYQGDVVALTHPAVIRAAILHALNAPASGFFRIEVPPLARFELRRSAQGWTWWPGI